MATYGSNLLINGSAENGTNNFTTTGTPTTVPGGVVGANAFKLGPGDRIAQTVNETVGREDYKLTGYYYLDPWPKGASSKTFGKVKVTIGSEVYFTDLVPLSSKAFRSMAGLLNGTATQWAVFEVLINPQVESYPGTSSFAIEFVNDSTDLTLYLDDLQFLPRSDVDIPDRSITEEKLAYLTITGAVIQDAAITTAKIADAAITSAKIEDATITNAKIDRATVNKLQVVTADIVDANITSAKIALAAIDQARIKDAAITTAKIMDLAVTSAKIAHASIGTVQIDDLAVTGAKIAAATITNANIQDATITTANIGLAMITEALIADLSVTNAKIANLAVGTAEIQDAAITNAKINNLAVDSAKIAVAAIETAKIKDAAITTAKIGDAQITNAKIDRASINKLQVVTADIVDANITNAKIGNLAVNTAKIADLAVTTAKIANLAVDSAKIKDAAITTAKIETGAITTALIADGQITSAKIGDAQITDAKIVGLTANKLTAGTIDGAQINVTNLVADNIVAGTLTFASANLVRDAAMTDPTKWALYSGAAGSGIIMSHDPTGGILSGGAAIVDMRGNVDPANALNYAYVRSLPDTDSRFPVIPGERYTVSVYNELLSGTPTAEIISLRLYCYAEDGTFLGAALPREGSLDTSTGRKVAGILPLEGSVTAYVMVLVSNSTVHIKLSNIMVQKGNLAGEWQLHTNELLAAKGITNIQLGDSAVDNRVIQAETITGDKLVVDTITAREIAAKTITAAEMVAGTITAASGIIADAAITTAKIADAAITNAKIDALDAGKITTGVLDAARVKIGATTTFEEGFDPTKNATEMISQAYITDINARPLEYGSYTVVPSSEIGDTDSKNIVKTEGSQLVRSKFIPYVPGRKLYLGVSVYEKDTAPGTFYAGVEFFDKDKVALATNDATIYAVSTSTREVNTWINFDREVPVSATDALRNQAAYIRLRILTRWSGNTGTSYLKNISLRQIGGYIISEMEDDLSGLNVLVGGWQYPDTTYIDGGNIYTSSILATSIAARTITANEIAAGTITANELKVGTITAASGILADAAITNAKITNATIENAKIKDLTITGSKISDATLTGAKLVDATIGTAKIADAAITTAKIGDAQITSAKIASLDAGKITTGYLNAARINVHNFMGVNLATAESDVMGYMVPATVNSQTWYKYQYLAYYAYLVDETQPTGNNRPVPLEGDEVVFDFEMIAPSSTSEPAASLLISIRDATNTIIHSGQINLASLYVIAAGNTPTRIQHTYKIPDGAFGGKDPYRWSANVMIGSTQGTVYVRNVDVRQRIRGSLIVQGDIEAKNITAWEGLNINNDFIVDSNGNVSFSGALAAGTSISSPVITSGSITGSVITLTGLSSKLDCLDSTTSTEFKATLNNGGFEQYRYTTPGNNASYVYAALRDGALNADRSSNLVGVKRDVYYHGDLPYEYGYYPSGTRILPGVVETKSSNLSGIEAQTVKQLDGTNYPSTYARPMYLLADRLGIGYAGNAVTNGALMLDIRGASGNPDKAMISAQKGMHFRLLQPVEDVHWIEFHDNVKVHGGLDIEDDSDVLRFNCPTHAYIEWNLARLGTFRNAYMGFGSSTTTTLSFVNEVSGGALVIDTSGTAGAALTLYGDVTGSSHRFNNLYNETTTAGANMHLNSSGYMYRSSSARKYKLQEEAIPLDEAKKVLQVEPKTWYDKRNSERYAELLSKEIEEGVEIDWVEEGLHRVERVPGLVAEDLMDAGLGRFVMTQKNEAGVEEPEEVMYDRLPGLFIPLIRELYSKVEELERKLVANGIV